MRKKSCISVAISVKGTSPTIGRAIRGFLNQTLLPHEVIVVGDVASNQRVQESLSSGNRARVQWVTFSGEKNDARNKGFEHAGGEFIFFCDHDMIPSVNLIKECNTLSRDFDALIIPERGYSRGSLLQRISSLEKKLVMEDPDAITPRLFRRSFFSFSALPFDNRFGVLDEWGFYMKLKKHNPRIGITKSTLTVIDNDSLFSRLLKNFKKGQSIHNLAESDSHEALRRVNPITRGVVFYGKRLSRIFSDPVEFTGLIIVKLLDLTSLTLGYVYGFIQ